MSEPHRVVVVGGGFAGLRAVQTLRRAPVAVRLVDRRNHHVFQPLLYQVAAGALSPANICAPLRSVLRRQRNAEVVLGEVTGFDLARRAVLLAEQSLPYDWLIVAVGSRYNYFGKPWEQLAPSLKSVEDSTEMRGRILLALEHAEWEQDPAARSRLLTFVIIGAGPTGVELAGALAEIARYTVKREFRHIDPGEIRILLLEAADRVLSPFPPRLSRSAEQSLRKLNVEVRTGCLAVDITPHHVEVACGEQRSILPTQTVFWTAGVRGTSLADVLAQAAGAEQDRIGRVKVEADLTLPGHPEVFVIGDMAHCLDGEGNPLPGLAPVAMQQGKYAARTIANRLGGRPAGEPFRYRDYGTMATIGRTAAVAHLGGICLSGFLAWLIWLFVHLMQIVTFRNRVLVFLQWMWYYAAFNKSAQLITEPHPTTERSEPSQQPQPTPPDADGRP